MHVEWRFLFFYRHKNASERPPGSYEEALLNLMMILATSRLPLFDEFALMYKWEKHFDELNRLNISDLLFKVVPRDVYIRLYRALTLIFVYKISFSLNFESVNLNVSVCVCLFFTTKCLLFSILTRIHFVYYTVNERPHNFYLAENNGDLRVFARMGFYYKYAQFLLTAKFSVKTHDLILFSFLDTADNSLTTFRSSVRKNILVILYYFDSNAFKKNNLYEENTSDRFIRVIITR